MPTPQETQLLKLVKILGNTSFATSTLPAFLKMIATESSWSLSGTGKLNLGTEVPAPGTPVSVGTAMGIFPVKDSKSRKQIQLHALGTRASISIAGALGKGGNKGLSLRKLLGVSLSTGFLPGKQYGNIFAGKKGLTESQIKSFTDIVILHETWTAGTSLSFNVAFFAKKAKTTLDVMASALLGGLGDSILATVLPYATAFCHWASTSVTPLNVNGSLGYKHLRVIKRI